MSEDNERETDEARDERQHRQDKDKLIERTEQNKANEQTWNNSGLLRDIQSRQCEVLERLGEMKVTIGNIEEHTTVMNSELGSCKEDIADAKKDIADLKNRTIFKLGWKELAKISGSIGGIVTLVITILKFIFHM
jgi:hypothetical protein